MVNGQEYSGESMQSVSRGIATSFSCLPTLRRKFGRAWLRNAFTYVIIWLSTRRKRDSEEAWLIACLMTRSVMKLIAAIVSVTSLKLRWPRRILPPRPKLPWATKGPPRWCPRSLYVTYHALIRELRRIYFYSKLL